MLSRPSILARNNQQAVIVVGQEVPIPTSNQITETGQQIQSVTYQDVGIILRVTPFITVNKTVEMIVSPEISSLSTQTVAALVELRRAHHQQNVGGNGGGDARPDDGGHRRVDAKADDVQGQQGAAAGGYPVCGERFKRTTKTDNKTELLIFMTPYIVEGTDKLEELTVDQIKRTDLPQETFTPNDVHQYLDDNLQMNTVPKPTTTTTRTTTRRTTLKTVK